MSDEFQITPPTIQAAGTDVPPEQIQSAFNSVCRQTQLALNVLATQPVPPTGPAGGDLGGTYPNPTVVGLHVTSGTESGVTITASTLDSSPVGSVTPASGAFTTLTATTPVAITSGGTGSGTAAGARTNLGLGTIATQNANNVAITGGTIDNTPIGQTTTAAGSFTTLNSTGGALNGTVGATTPNTGSFTALNSTSGALNGSIGATTPNTGSFTTVTASTPISVANGGTGRATLIVDTVLVGNGTAAVAQIGPGTNGQALIGQTGTFPTFGFPTGALVNVQRFTSTGTYTATTGTNSVIVEMCGGGGGGGGCGSSTASTGGAAAGGGGGAWARVKLTSSFSGVTVTIGAAGAGGVAGANNGTTGGQSTFGALITCPGGIGGTGATPSTTPGVVFNDTTAAAASTTTGTALVLATGAPGELGLAFGIGSIGSGFGGGSVFGSGAPGVVSSTPGQNAVSAGTGGSGAGSANGGAAMAGGNGAAGLCIVYEYA